MFRRTFLVFTFLALFVTIGLSQDSHDKFKVAVGYTGTEFKFDPNDASEYLNGYWVDADARIVAKGGFRLGGVFNYERTLNMTQIDPMAYPKPGPVPAFDVVQRDTDTFSFGARLSYKVGPVEPFGAALFGFRNPTDVTTRKFTRRYQLGADLGLGHFFVRPFFLEYEFTEGFVGASTHKYGTGAGFRF